MAFMFIGNCTASQNPYKPSQQPVEISSKTSLEKESKKPINNSSNALISESVSKHFDKSSQVSAVASYKTSTTSRISASSVGKGLDHDVSYTHSTGYDARNYKSPQATESFLLRQRHIYKPCLGHVEHPNTPPIFLGQPTNLIHDELALSIIRENHLSNIKNMLQYIDDLSVAVETEQGAFGLTSDSTDTSVPGRSLEKVFECVVPRINREALDHYTGKVGSWMDDKAEYAGELEI